MSQQQQQQTQQRGRSMNGGRGNEGTGQRERPAHVVRFGTIKAAVWRNVVDNGNATRPIYNVTFSRSYKDGEEWKDSQSFGLEDLLVLAKAANDCHTWIYEQRARESAEAT